MAARNRTWTPDVVRERIRTSMLVTRLTKHALGKLDMTSTQVTAAQVLLRKSLPDLTAVAHTGNIHTTNARELTDDRLADIAAGSSSRVIESQELPKEPSEVH